MAVSIIQVLEKCTELLATMPRGLTDSFSLENIAAQGGLGVPLNVFLVQVWTRCSREKLFMYHVSARNIRSMVWSRFPEAFDYSFEIPSSGNEII